MKKILWKIRKSSLGPNTSTLKILKKTLLHLVDATYILPLNFRFEDLLHVSQQDVDFGMPIVSNLDHCSISAVSKLERHDRRPNMYSAMACFLFIITKVSLHPLILYPPFLSSCFYCIFKIFCFV